MTHNTNEKLPLHGLIALASAGFITLMTEVMPAGLLPQIGAGLDVPQSMAGQLVTAYALGAVITAIPLMTMTQTMGRRGLLVGALGGFAVVNAVTAISGMFWLTLVARFFAGMFGGIVWALLVGYAARMVPAHLAGRAIAVTGIGAPLAFSFGVPAGTWMGGAFGWQTAFAAMSVSAVVLMGFTIARLPDFAGTAQDTRHTVTQVLRLPGLCAILIVMFITVVGHNTLYTYIAPFLVPAGLGERVDLVLLVFGMSSLVGLWVVGVLIDRYLRALVLVGLLMFGAIAGVLGLTTSPVFVLACVMLWGIVMGGAPTVFQTAEARVAQDATDIAQAMFVTVWNTGVAGAGVFGGLMLNRFGASALPWAVLAMIVPAFIIAVSASRHGFTRGPH